jgi:hypothetical protein
MSVRGFVDGEKCLFPLIRRVALPGAKQKDIKIVVQEVLRGQKLLK